MKTRKQQVSEMIDALQDDLIKQEIIKDYRQFAYDNDERLKGNLEAKKELNASASQIDRTTKMLEWLNKELLRCE
jgi:hypothetical protein